MMGWQLDRARAADVEKMRQLTRLFIPNLNTFPENFTTTSLGVDDLVKHCYEVGYVKPGSNSAPNTNVVLNAASSMTVRAGVTTVKTGKKQRNKKAKSDRASHPALCHLERFTSSS